MTVNATDISALTQQLTTDNLSLWSDDKRKAFVETFEERVRVTRFILLATAEFVANKAKDRSYISRKHLIKIGALGNSKYDTTVSFGQYNLCDKKNDYRSPNMVGGRLVSELEQIATDQAVKIIKQLPGLAATVRILSPETAALIERRSKLLAKGKELLAESEAYSGRLNVNEMDQNMTLAEFSRQVKAREKKRRAIVQQLDEIGVEGRELSSRIDKYLYDGLPGLSEAVIKVVTDYVERATGFSALSRRVAEQVQFGDSESAMAIFKAFEKDEATISDEIKTQFDTALEQLKAASVKGLPARRSKKLSA